MILRVPWQLFMMKTKLRRLRLINIHRVNSPTIQRVKSPTIYRVNSPTIHIDNSPTIHRVNNPTIIVIIIIPPLWLGGIRIQPTFALVRVVRGD